MNISKLKICYIFMCFGMLPVKGQVINSGIKGNTTTDILGRLKKDVLDKKPDLVILMVGTNDMLNSKKMNSYKSYKKNVKTLVNKIDKTGSDVLLMSSPPVDSVYLFERHDKSLFKESPNQKLNNAREIVSQIASQNELYFLDIYQHFTDLNLPEHNKDLFFRNVLNSNTRDGVHLTALGYRFLAELVFQYLKVNNLLGKYDKIICLGDSITNGSGVENKEKAYPGVLRGMLNY